MDKKIEGIHKILDLPKSEIALVLYTYLTLILEDLVKNKKASTLFGELILDDEGKIAFKNNRFEFDNDLFSKKDMISIIHVVENGPGRKIF
jgi:hypothetical protein